MHAPHNNYRTDKKNGVEFLILPAALVFVVIALVVFHPKASLWISQAVQAEFGGSLGSMTPQIVQPNMVAPMRTVHAD